jgi:hypothetical protein
MKHQLISTLYKIVEIAETIGKPPIVVEAGHFYANREPDANVEVGALLGVGVLGFLEQAGIKTSAMVFVDDLVNRPEELPGSLEQIYIQSGLDKIATTGFKPSLIVNESSLIPRGDEIIRQLEIGGKTKENKGRTMLKNGWVPLTGKNGKSTLPSCQTLDAALYEQKISDHGGAVTVLEKSYARQQQQTKLVLEAMGVINPNILVLLFEGEDVDIEYWGTKYE